MGRKGKSYMGRLRRRARYLQHIVDEGGANTNKNLQMIAAELAAMDWAIKTLDELISKGVVSEPEDRVDG